MLLSAMLASFAAASALSELVGGGPVSVAGLMTGDFGACDMVGSPRVRAARRGAPRARASGDVRG